MVTVVQALKSTSTPPGYDGSGISSKYNYIQPKTAVTNGSPFQRKVNPSFGSLLDRAFNSRARDKVLYGSSASPTPMPLSFLTPFLAFDIAYTSY